MRFALYQIRDTKNTVASNLGSFTSYLIRYESQCYYDNDVYIFFVLDFSALMSSNTLTIQILTIQSAIDAITG